MAREQISIKGEHPYRLDGWKHSIIIRLLLFFGFIMLFYFAISNKMISETYDIELGSISQISIHAPSKIENAVATQKAKEEAAHKVQSIYPVISMRNVDLVEIIFDRIEQINLDDQVTFEDKVQIYHNEIPRLFSDFYDNLLKNMSTNVTYNETLITEIRNRVNEQQYRIPEETFFKFPRLTSEDLVEMIPVSRTIVAKLMADQLLDAQTARAKVAEMVNTSQLTRKNTRELVQEITRFVITPNKFHDQEGTEEARIQARENTEIIYIKENDVLVHKGDLITEEMYERLQSLELLKNKTNFWPQLGLIIMVSLVVFVFYIYIRQNQHAILHNNAKLFMLALIFLLNIIVMKIVALGQSVDYSYIGYVAPIALGTMLITILMEAQLAYISAMIFSLLAGIIFNLHDDLLFDFRFGLVAAVVGFISIFTIHRASQRLTILKSGIMVSLFSSIAIMSVFLLEGHYVMKDIILSLSFASAGGLFTAVLVIGLLPFFEIAFGILSPLKLVELSNPNHPLLRKLLTETPGTYHHSIMVGNLSEAAAESIGANGLLCRVGSFYHDVGKTKRPSYFIENQGNVENPHDSIEPSLSKSIIIAHARDGVEMLKDYKMPKQFCDIAEQHHGTTLLQYFYHKALKQLEQAGDNGVLIPEEEYRYPGPKAQTKEAAIIGIADCVEAAVRSLRNPTIEQIDRMVDKIIKSRLDDNQYNECDLTLKELDTIGKTLKKSLLGIFHSRIEYPEDMPNKNGRKGELGA